MFFRDNNIIDSKIFPLLEDFLISFQNNEKEKKIAAGYKGERKDLPGKQKPALELEKLKHTKIVPTTANRTQKPGTFMMSISALESSHNQMTVPTGVEAWNNIYEASPET